MPWYVTVPSGISFRRGPAGGQTLAASYRALRDHYQHREHDLTQDMAARQEWEHATGRSRRLAIAADAELRRRHPRRKIEPLRSAEPAPASETGCDPLQPAADGKLTKAAALIRDPAVQRERFRAEMDEHPRLIVPGDHGKAFRAMKTPGQDAILQPPRPEITPPRPGSSTSPQRTTSNPRPEANHS